MNTRGIEGLDIRGFVRMMRRLFRTREVFLRELVQNSLEALHQAERHGSTEAGEVRVESGGNSTVVVRDNGIGMTREQLLTDLTVLFKSGWPSEGGES